jgi:phosphonate transport system substrate-binding protein
MQPQLALAVTPDTAGNYKTALVAPAASPIRTLKDVAAHAPNTRLMLVGPGSTSGNLVPRLALSGAGLPDAEAVFNKVIYGGSHAAVIDSVAAATVGLGAMGNTTYNDFTAKPGNNSRVQLVWLSPEIPLGPVLLHNRLPKKLKRRIVRLLLQLHEQNPAALQRVKDGWSEAKNAIRYITIGDSYYNPFRRQLGAPEHVTHILEQFAN